jgi:hypothetical protein
VGECECDGAMRALMLDGLEDEAMPQLSLCLRPEQGDEVCVLEDSGLVNPPGDFRPGGHRPVPPGPLARDVRSRGCPPAQT